MKPSLIELLKLKVSAEAPPVDAYSKYGNQHISHVTLIRTAKASRRRTDNVWTRTSARETTSRYPPRPVLRGGRGVLLTRHPHGRS